MNKTLKAHLALLGANLIYAASFSIAKKVTDGPIHPFGLVLLRVSGAVILFWLTSLLVKYEKVERKDFRHLMILAIFGVAVNQLMFLKGLSLTSPISASIMMITTPILVLIIAALVIRERITLLRVLGIALGFTGAFLLMIGNHQSTGRSDNHSGDLFVFINALSWGIYLVLVKRMMKKYHTITILRWVFLFGWFLVLPFGLSEFREVNWSGLTSGDWGNALFVVIGTTYMAYILNTFALGELSPSVVSAYIYLQPILAAGIALYLGTDHLDLLKIVSALLIFCGVYLVSRQRQAGKTKASDMLKPEH
jgi:drug/metabolite transporter (DMT)-like permease